MAYSFLNFASDAVPVYYEKMLCLQRSGTSFNAHYLNALFLVRTDWQHICFNKLLLLHSGPLSSTIKSKRHQIKSDPTPFGYEGITQRNENPCMWNVMFVIRVWNEGMSSVWVGMSDVLWYECAWCHGQRAWCCELNSSLLSVLCNRKCSLCMFGFFGGSGLFAPWWRILFVPNVVSANSYPVFLYNKIATNLLANT